MLLDVRGLEKLPHLKEFLTDPKLELEGETVDRDPGSVYFSVRDGVIQVTLKEPSQKLMMRLESPSVAALLSTIEAALGGGSSLWEADPWARGPKRGKKR